MVGADCERLHLLRLCKCGCEAQRARVWGDRRAGSQVWESLPVYASSLQHSAVNLCTHRNVAKSDCHSKGRGSRLNRQSVEGCPMINGRQSCDQTSTRRGWEFKTRCQMFSIFCSFGDISGNWHGFSHALNWGKTPWVAATGFATEGHWAWAPHQIPRRRSCFLVFSSSCFLDHQKKDVVFRN